MPRVAVGGDRLSTLVYLQSGLAATVGVVEVVYLIELNC